MRVRKVRLQAAIAPETRESVVQGAGNQLLLLLLLQTAGAHKHNRDGGESPANETKRQVLNYLAAADAVPASACVTTRPATKQRE